MHIPEFSRAVRVYQRQSLMACIIPLSMAMVCIIAYVPFQHQFERFLSSRFEGSAVDILTVMPMVVPVALAFTFMIPWGRRIERRAGIACPFCGQALANHKAIVIASRNCPDCGNRVIEDEAQTG